MTQPKDANGMNQQQCCLCGAASPMTKTNYTLISTKHQWRMELRTEEDGSRVPCWYCPSCWQVAKRTRSTPAKHNSSP